jgi:hypothetical protein
MRAKLLRSALAASAVAIAALALPAAAGAVNPPACDPSVYPIPFLVFDGSIFTGDTRYLVLRQNKHATDSLSGQSDPEYPFPVDVALTSGGSLHFTAHDYARDQFPVKFVPRSIRATATTTYVEAHTEEDAATPVHTVRCTRTVKATFKAPPKPKKKKHHRGGGGGGGQGEDDD